MYVNTLCIFFSSSRGDEIIAEDFDNFPGNVERFKEISLSEVKIILSEISYL